MLYFEMLPESNRRIGFFEQEQHEGVPAKLPDYLKGVLTVAYWTEMRKSEILGLMWKQIDLLNRLAFLVRTRTVRTARFHLNDELYAMMTGQARIRVAVGLFVFHRDRVRNQSFAKAWRTAC